MSEWKKVKLGDIIDIKHGYAFSGEHIIEEDNNIVLVTPGNFRIGGGFQERKCKYYDGEIPEDYILKSGDFIVTMTDLSKSIDTLGYSAIVPDSPCRKYLHNQRIGLVQFKNDTCDMGYIYWLMRTRPYQKEIANTSTGATVHHTSPSKICAFEFNVPSFSIQQRIATILSRYDSLIENYQKQIKLLEESAQRLYKEWFINLRFPGHENTKIVDGVPEGWEKKTIGDIVVYHDKQRKPLSSMQRMNMEKIYPYYGAAALMDYVDSYLFDGIYLLFGEDGTVITPDNFPVLQYVWGKFWVNNHAHVIRGIDGVSTEFLYSMFKEMPIADVVTGAAQPKISQGRLSDKKILMPSLKLIQEWSCTAKHYFGRIRMITDQIRHLTEARDRLLPKLMSGEINV